MTQGSDFRGLFICPGANAAVLLQTRVERSPSYFKCTSYAHTVQSSLKLTTLANHIISPKFLDLLMPSLVHFGFLNETFVFVRKTSCWAISLEYYCSSTEGYHLSLPKSDSLLQPREVMMPTDVQFHVSMKNKEESMEDQWVDQIHNCIPHTNVRTGDTMV